MLDYRQGGRGDTRSRRGARRLTALPRKTAAMRHGIPPNSAPYRSRPSRPRRRVLWHISAARIVGCAVADAARNSAYCSRIAPPPSLAQNSLPYREREPVKPVNICGSRRGRSWPKNRTRRRKFGTVAKARRRFRLDRRGSRNAPAGKDARRAQALWPCPALASLALLIRAALPVPEGTAIYQLPIVAVLLSGWFGGRGPGLFASLICAATILYRFIPPANSFELTPDYALGFFIFIALCLLLSEFSSGSRRAAMRSA